MNRPDSPGVYIPPPLIYAGFFFSSFLLQRLFPIGPFIGPFRLFSILTYLILSAGFILLLPALWKFLVTKNTLVTIKPANSLQTSGIYSFTRNPMYLGLLFIYTGLALQKGNGWTLLLIPLLIWTMQQTVIRREEKYLARRFPDDFPRYRQKVRRWI